MKKIVENGKGVNNLAVGLQMIGKLHMELHEVISSAIENTENFEKI